MDLAHFLGHFLEELVDCLNYLGLPLVSLGLFLNFLFIGRGVFVFGKLLDGRLFGKDHLFVVIQVFVDCTGHFFSDRFGVLIAILTVELVLLILFGFLGNFLRGLSSVTDSLSLVFVVADNYFRRIFRSSTALLAHQFFDYRI